MSIIDDQVSAVTKWAKKKGVGNSLRGYDRHGEPEGIVDSVKDLHSLHASTEILVKDIAAELTKRMPGFRWAIQPSEFGKVFNIFCLDFSGRWGYRIKYSDIMNDPKRKEAIRAGREILRRFGYPGVKYDKEAVALVYRNAQGEAIPYVGDKKKTQFTEKARLEMLMAKGEAEVVGTRGKGQIIMVKK